MPKHELPDLILVTIPHTGTRWTEDLFIEHRPKWHELNLNFRGTHHQWPHLYRGHCVHRAAVDDAIEKAKSGIHMIMTMRHPYRVEESWRRRGKDLRELLQCYTHFLDHLRPYVSAYVPIDGSPVGKEIAERVVNNVANTTLKYRWDKKKNVDRKSCTYDLSLLDTDPSDHIRLVRSHEVFTEFYGRQKDEDEWVEFMTRSDGSARERASSKAKTTRVQSAAQ